jgi:RHS repeat-associated protein
VAEYRIHTRRCRSVGLTEFGEAAPQFVIVDEAHREHIVYTVGGLDAPLSLKREGLATSYVILPHTNYRGQFNSGSTSTGVAVEETIYWPGNDRRSYGDIVRTAQGVAWAGSVITEYQGESGQQYKRNRYYDPTTGRFTQEDPIGLAGGMNLYGYVGGDPINFGDPFGLCPPKDHNSSDCSWMHEKGLESAGLLDPVAWLSGYMSTRVA